MMGTILVSHALDWAKDLMDSHWLPVISTIKAKHESNFVSTKTKLIHLVRGLRDFDTNLFWTSCGIHLVSQNKDFGPFVIMIVGNCHLISADLIFVCWVALDFSAIHNLITIVVFLFGDT